MNRREEYQALMNELDQSVPALETTLNRAYQKKRKRTRKMIVRPIAGLAACFAAFVLLVNFCAPVAYACSQVPGLRELAEAVTFSQSLSDAVENAYVQTMDLTQTDGDITAEVAYLIVDQKQVNVFYRLDSEVYVELEADPEVLNSDDARPASCSYGNNSFDMQNGELRSITIDFMDGNVPDSLRLRLNVYSTARDFSGQAPENVDNHMFFDDVYTEPDYLAEFDFLLEFDPAFTASGKVFPVNQTVELEGQMITITEIEVYPTHMRVDIAESEDNTAWLQNLEFYIETDWGMKFDPVSNGISATGSADTLSMVSYRADSTYFYEAEHLKLVITGARWLRKDRQTMYLNLVTGKTGEMPEGVAFASAERQGNGWVVTFRVDLEKGKSMFQPFRDLFYDDEGHEYEINMWSGTYGDADEDGNITYYLDQFPLKDYPYDEVWLCPQYSHYWTAEDLIVITIQ